jgi:hypothetical protein
MIEIQYEGEEIRYPTARYIECNIPKIRLLAETIARSIPKDTDGFKHIQLLVRGTSGCMIAPEVVKQIMFRFKYHRVSIFISRKTNSHHAGYIDPIPRAYNIFVDDFISTGTTYSIVKQEYMSARWVKEERNKIHMVAVSGSTKNANKEQLRIDGVDILIERKPSY